MATKKSRSKIFVLSLGCPRNLVDSEVLIGILKKKSFSITDDAGQASIYIVNTCGFIEKAKEESVDAILKLAAFKKDSKNGKKILIVTGCLSQRYPVDLPKEIPEIDAVFGSSDFHKIPDFIMAATKPLATSRQFPVSESIVSETPDFLYDHKYKRDFITPKHFAYLKLQEGCMNFCSYCIIPKLRGPYRSRTMNSVLEEAESLKAGGVKEINLIGQDTTLYGMDLYSKPKLPEMLKKISKIMKGRWVRLLYAHPAHITDELISVIKNEEAVTKYIDIPIQHISDDILKRMNRKTTKKEITGLIGKIRKDIPGAAIRTSVMVGFPGETDKEFKELLEFIKEVKFEKLGAFTYSQEEGTPSYNYPGQVSELTKEARYDEILKTQQGISIKNNEKMLDKIFKVLIDAKDDKDNSIYYGRTYMDAPEVDGICYVRSEKAIGIGTFLDVRVTDTLEYDLVGEPV